MRSTELCLCLLFALVDPGPAQACTTYAIRGLTARINEGPLSISLLLESDIELFIYGPDLSELVNRKDKQWHDISTTRNGSMNCVTSPTLWVGEKCSASTYWLILRSNVTTLWRLGCSAGSERCSQLLETVFLGLDALPTTLHWKPRDAFAGLFVYGKGFAKHFSVTNSWHDLSISPDGDESLCTVHSTSLNFSVPCSQNATARDFLRIGEKGIGQSFFALDCVQISDSILGGWGVPVLLLSLGIMLLLLPVALLRLRKRRRERKGVFHPEEDQHYVTLRSGSRPMPPHDKRGLHLLDRQRGKLDDPEEDEEHVYCYMDMEMLRKQLERDRRAAAQAQQQERDPDAVSVCSHDSRNSLYDELKAIEARHNREGKGEYEYEEEDKGEEEDRDVEEEEDKDEEEDRYVEEEEGEGEEDWDEEEEEGEDEEDRDEEEEEGEDEEDRSKEEEGERDKEVDNGDAEDKDEEEISHKEEDRY